WRAFMHSTQDLGLQRIVEAVGKTLEALKKALPQLDPVSALGGEPAAFGVLSSPTIPKTFAEAADHITCADTTVGHGCNVRSKSTDGARAIATGLQIAASLA